MLKRRLTQLPAGLLTVITFLAILWLTLAPKPLGENPPPLFPGADKIAHAIMFGGLSFMMLLDWQRKNKWERVKGLRAFMAALISSGLGILIEFLQWRMNLGRGFEYSDMIADAIGAFSFSYGWILLQNFLVENECK